MSLDQIGELLDRGKFEAVTEEQVSALIAELRASRKVVEAARRLIEGWLENPVNTLADAGIVAAQEWMDAMGELRSINAKENE